MFNEFNSLLSFSPSYGGIWEMFYTTVFVSPQTVTPLLHISVGFNMIIYTMSFLSILFKSTIVYFLTHLLFLWKSETPGKKMLSLKVAALWNKEIKFIFHLN